MLVCRVLPDVSFKKITMNLKLVFPYFLQSKYKKIPDNSKSKEENYKFIIRNFKDFFDKFKDYYLIRCFVVPLKYFASSAYLV